MQNTKVTRKIAAMLAAVMTMTTIKIYVGDDLAVDESNCSAHSEWKP